MKSFLLKPSAAGVVRNASYSKALGIAGIRMATTAKTNLAGNADAYEIIDFSAGHSRTLVTAEHASVELPFGYSWPEQDKRLVGDHWSYDPGSSDMARELTKDLNAVGLLSRYSRLLVDVNRPLNSPTLFRDIADGKTIELNNKMAAEEKKKRIKYYYKPYHTALKRILKVHPIRLVLSIHSFTPVYEGARRQVEIGVLFNKRSDLAKSLQKRFAGNGCDARLNEPWSGKKGFMFAVDAVANHERRCVMLEFRNDLLRDSAWRARVRRLLVDELRKQNLA